MTEYIVTDEDIKTLKEKCDDFFTSSIIDEWVLELKKKQKLLVSKANMMTLIQKFNTLCTDLPKVKELTDTRKSAIKARLNEHSFETIIKVFNMAQESDYLSGRSKKWMANFDWIMKQTNFVKVLEGNYKNIPRSFNIPSDQKPQFHKNS